MDLGMISGISRLPYRFRQDICIVHVIVNSKDEGPWVSQWRESMYKNSSSTVGQFFNFIPLFPRSDSKPSSQLLFAI